MMPKGPTKELDSRQTERNAVSEQPPFDKAAFLARLKKLHAHMPMTHTTVEDMRREHAL